MSDRIRTQPDTTWRQPGVGHHSSWLCPRCNIRRPTMGRRKWGTLLQCAACIESKEKAHG